MLSCFRLCRYGSDRPMCSFIGSEVARALQPASGGLPITACLKYQNLLKTDLRVTIK
jgi:hypothetical protein